MRILRVMLGFGGGLFRRRVRDQVRVTFRVSFLFLDGKNFVRRKFVGGDLYIL